jgi:hypothetical protein
MENRPQEVIVEVPSSGAMRDIKLSLALALAFVDRRRPHGGKLRMMTLAVNT